MSSTRNHNRNSTGCYFYCNIPFVYPVYVTEITKHPWDFLTIMPAQQKKIYDKKEKTERKKKETLKHNPLNSIHTESRPNALKEK